MGQEVRVRWFQRYPRLTLTLLGLAAVLLLDAIVGSGLEALGSNPALRKSDLDFRMPHPVYHHGLVPMVTSKARWGMAGYAMHTDSLGFRNASSKEIPLRSEWHRVLLIGDSFVEGIGVDFESSFAGLLAERLSLQDVELMNAGVVSYAPSIYHAKLGFLIEELKLDFDEVIVFIDLSDIEDEARYYRADEHGRVYRTTDSSARKQILNFIERNTVLASTLRTSIRNVRERFRTRPRDGQLDRSRCLWGEDEALFDAWGREGLARATAHMSELQALLVEHHIPLSIAVYPWPDQVRIGRLEALQVRHWRVWAATNQVDFIDLFPAFIEGRDPEVSLERYFIPFDVHWNEAGHALVAEALTGWWNARTRGSGRGGALVHE